jgi:long-chain acyl-CoA synthetase
MPPPEARIDTLVDLFRRTVSAEKANLLNYKRAGAWHAVSARELDQKTRATAMGLYALGVRAGDRVALLAENSPEWTIADLGTLNCGAADVPIYATQSPRQVAYILDDAGVEVIFVSTREQYERVREALDGASRLRSIILFEPFETDDRRVMSFDQLLERGRDADAREPDLYETLRASVASDSLATLIYTSGTTGEPKGVMLTHGNIVSNVLASAGILPFDSESVVLSSLPLSHIFERSGFYLYLYGHATIFYAESIDLVGQNMREVRPHFLTSVPRLFEKIHDRAMERAESSGRVQGAIARWAVEVAKDWAEVASRHGKVGLWLNLKRTLALKLVFARWRASMGGRIRFFVSGGASLSTDLARIFYGAGLPILQGYGLTESSPVISANTPAENRLGSVGRPLEGVSVRIAEDGEVLCSGPNIMRGYYNRPAETAAALQRDGDGRIWLHTGDIGQLDADGFLFITDRKKDLLKTSGGKYIAPQPIESAIRQSRFVNQVVVIGDGRKFPAALIVPNMDALASYAALKGIAYTSPKELLEEPRIVDLIDRQVAKYTAELSQYEKIKAVALLGRELTVENGELTPTLKVRRRIVVEKYKDLIDRMYAAKESVVSR